MFFDEGRVLKQSHYKHPETGTPSSTAFKKARETQPRRDPEQHLTPEARALQAASMLDSANNKLQELMQLLYLLSRDPAVPKDARYHVTVAQGEIALLAHVMRNATQEQPAEPTPVPDNHQSYCAACP
jgi:hypothetical protein